VTAASWQWHSLHFRRYLKNAAALKLATGPYKVIARCVGLVFACRLAEVCVITVLFNTLQAARDAYVAATATYTKNLYE
jgi:hypothetical protein